MIKNYVCFTLMEEMMHTNLRRNIHQEIDYVAYSIF